jgi:dimethylamine/trimethylamine dehydrogenase
VTTAPHHRILFEPVRIGPKVLRNRFYQVPHGAFGSTKPGTTAAYRGMRAEGGWAAITTQQAPVGMSSDDAPELTEQWWTEHDAEIYRPTVEAAHAHGALAGLELYHGGAFTARRVSRAHALAPSGIATEIGPPYMPPETPRAMDEADIESVQQQFVAGAVRARDTGFDIVYAYGGHGYLMAQFLSPFHNKRTDRYGGSLENRARMWIETLARMKEAVGSDCAVAARISADARGPFGADLEETLAFIRLADEYVDLWDITLATHVNMGVDMGPSRFFREGYQLEWSGRIREATAKPIVGVSRLTNPDRMAEIVRSGVWDLIGSARASIADPFLPKKIEEGRLDEIRECMGINACTSRWLGGHLGCAQNATAGEEYRRGWHPERFEPVAAPDRPVLVVGAGPAGLECATVLGRRGATVHLVEADARVGGSLRALAQLPGHTEWGRFVDHRQILLAKLPNVSVITGQTLTAQDVVDYGAEVVVIATGATWSRDGLNGPTHEPLVPADVVASPLILTPDDLMAGRRPPAGARVVVYDAEGYFTAAASADLLSAEGYTVEFVTCFEQVAPWCDQTFEGEGLRHRLHERGVTFHRRVVATSIGEDVLRGVGEFEEPFELAFDAVVVATQRVPRDELFRQVQRLAAALPADEALAVYSIGDATSPRVVADVVFDAHRLAREIDEPDAQWPKDYRHETVPALIGWPEPTRRG